LEEKNDKMEKALLALEDKFENSSPATPEMKDKYWVEINSMTTILPAVTAKRLEFGAFEYTDEKDESK